MVTDPHILLATNPTNLEIMLQSTTKSDYKSTFIQLGNLSFIFHIDRLVLFFVEPELIG
jgi:hypothetical protein